MTSRLDKIRSRRNAIKPGRAVGNVLLFPVYLCGAFAGLLMRSMWGVAAWIGSAAATGFDDARRRDKEPSS